MRVSSLLAFHRKIAWGYKPRALVVRDAASAIEIYAEYGWDAVPHFGRIALVEAARRYVNNHPK